MSTSMLGKMADEFHLLFEGGRPSETKNFNNSAYFISQTHIIPIEVCSKQSNMSNILKPFCGKIFF